MFNFKLKKMKLLNVLNTVFKIVPKLDPIVEKVTESVGKRRIIKSIIRLVQIIVASYLLYKGLIESEEAIEIIKG